ncbi:MAG: DUF177 domain-containing protein [Actinomycetota bacterium]|nr:DUF177 domain-containing protein [Actinomycetota bacterium]
MSAELRSRSWLVPLATLRRAPGSRRQVEIAASIPELAITYSGVPEGVPVSFDGAIESFAGGVNVKGLVRAPFEGTCRRCLGVARGHLVAVVDEVCMDHPRPDSDYAIGPDYIDLEPMVHDACILELPLAPLCQEQCQGLCPYCGANRNQETCSCVEPDISSS